MWRSPSLARSGADTLEAYAERAGAALACAYSNSAEFDAALIAERRAAGIYGPRRHRRVRDRNHTVSLILDALRRKSVEHPADDEEQEPQARGVLATLGSASAVADSKQTLLCTYLSGVLLVGLGLNTAFGWSWADPVAALVIAAVAVKEGRAAWLGDSCCAPGFSAPREAAVDGTASNETPAGGTAAADTCADGCCPRAPRELGNDDG